MSAPDASARSEDSPQETSDEINSEDAPPLCIRFLKRGKEKQFLVAVVKPTPDYPAGFAVSSIRNWIRLQGCGGWLLHDEAISQLAREVRRIKQPKEYTLAERKDCLIEVQVSPDHLRAWIRVSPAFGGEALTEPLLRQALVDQHVCFGVDEELLQRIVLDGGCERKLIAEGVDPTQGEAARFERLIHESEHKGVPQEREDGSVDYKELGLFISVAKGTPLLRRIPPVPGIPGRGVDGTLLPAPAGTDHALLPGIGTAILKDDPNVIIATRVGQPSFLENSVSVDPTLEVERVDPSTGNVFFEGNILIRGSVEPGFTIKAGQDLTILDTAEGSNLSAGKNIFLLTGVYGRNRSEINAGGNVEARFLSDCKVRCGGNIEVSDLIAHCDVECEGSLTIGKHGGKGQSYGGRLLALRGIWAQILGSVSETPTLVEVAAPRPLLAQQARTDSALDGVKRDLESVEKELHVAESQGSRAGGLRARLAALSAKLENLKKEQQQLQEKLAALKKARIKAAEVHRGVTLCIGTVRQAVSDVMHDVCLQQPPEPKSPQ